MKYGKRKQKEIFTEDNYISNPKPVWSAASKRQSVDDIAGPSRKRLKKEERIKRDIKLKEALDSEMIARLTKKIHGCISDNCDTNNLKKTCLEMTQIERGTISSAEEKNGLAAGSITTFLRNNKKSNISFWYDIINEHFDDLVRKVLQEKSQAESSGYPTDGTLDEVESDIVDEDVDDTADLNLTRTFSTPLLATLRKDLPPDMKDWIIQTLDTTLQNTTDYLVDFSIRTYKLLLLFTEYSFRLNGDNTFHLKTNKGLGINEIFPANPQYDNAYFAPPWDPVCLKNDVFQKHLKELFKTSHLQTIHSSYFGNIGVSNATLDKHPLQKAIFQVMPRVEEEVKHGTDASAMKLALAGYMINFSNMWSEPKRYFKLLNRLLQVLLKIHLAPLRDKQYKDYVANKMQEKKHMKQAALGTSLKFANKSRNSRRRIFKGERKRAAIYENKADLYPEERERWKKKAERSKERLNIYKETLKKELISLGKQPINLFQEESDELLDVQILSEENPAVAIDAREIEDQIEDTTTDLPRRRLNLLQRILRTLLLKSDNKSITNEDILKLDEDIKANEAHVLTLLYNFIAPYIPDKNNRMFFSYQIPFILMCNQVFRAAGHSKFVVKLCPLVKPGSLCALRVDAATLFSMFCAKAAKEKQILAFDHANVQISTRQVAIRRKDAMFGSFFDLQKILAVAKSYGLTFSHYIIILPGLKTMRLVGQLKKYPPSNSCIKIDNNEKQETQTNLPAQLSHRSIDKFNTSKSEILALQDSETDLIAQLKSAVTERNDFITKKNIKNLKKQWWDTDNKDERQKLYIQIGNTKKQRDVVYQKVFNLTKQIKALRTDMYQVRNSYQIENKQVQKKIVITNEKYKFIEKAENVEIDESLLTDDLRLCGTDNGIISMTETCALDLKRFKYHLDLHNRFSQLSDGANISHFDEEDVELAFIPKKFKITSNQIQYQSGELKNQHLRNRKKGKLIQDIEKKLNVASLSSAENVEHLHELYKTHKDSKKDLREFYFSNNMVKKKRRSELQLRRTKDRICSNERRFVAGKSKLIMFVGDRGYGIGSSIKGHLKYGGKWKPEIHSRYTSVCTTNEHNTSQTCLFCFQKLSHPLKLIIKRGKQRVQNVKGTFVCNNKACILHSISSTHKGRDSVSALAIGISGAATVILQSTLPTFDPHTRTSQYNTGNFKKIADVFLNRITSRPATGGGNTV